MRDSQFCDFLVRVMKHSGYQLWALACKPALDPESKERNESINGIEQIAINHMDNNVGTITYDGMKHCAIIVRYTKKPAKYVKQSNKSITMVKQIQTQQAVDKKLETITV